MRGRLGQRELAVEMQYSRVWGYPTAFLETSCIGAMEARAAGLAIVTSELAALKETVGAHGTLLRWDEDEDSPANTSDSYRDAFVDEVVLALADELHWTELHRAARRGVASLDWSKRTRQWEELGFGQPTKRSRRRAKIAA
jgi:glycosyltransferase involved in cell wall biosynthesis